MLSTTTIRKSALTLAALGALGLGGSAIAGAADSGSSQNRQARPQREALSGDAAAKVKAAALAKSPGATVLRTEAGGPYATAYHAHIRTAAGKLRVVLVDASFKATAIQAERFRGGPGDHDGHGHGGPGGPGRHGETALTGDTKQKVEAAVLAKYAGATILRTETDAGSGAAYESHITTSGGKELEVLVNKDFEVVDAMEHPARP